MLIWEKLSLKSNKKLNYGNNNIEGSGLMKRSRLVLMGVISLIVLITFGAHAQLDQYGTLRLGNEYIEIVVNGNEKNMGRFAIDITGGNPISPGDDGEPLIYGRPKPWTSFTTLFLDGEYYVFGGETDKRAGRNGQYGKVTVPPQIVNRNGKESIVTTSSYGKMDVEQILSFSKSSTTGLYDTAQIKYRFINKDDKKHKIGLRVMMDTMLGTNDGAPFRVGEKAITTDTFFMKGSLPDFWQAFDALSQPKVTAQGTIKGPDVTTPDKVYFADWGSMADGLWDFEFEPGSDFLRKGEFELDSAIALYWAPEYLEPGQSVTYVTKYGLGGITIVPGLLSLGVTSPAEVTFDTQTDSFPVIAYIENTSEIVTKDVQAKIDLPKGFTLRGTKRVKKLGNLEPGSTGQVAWEVVPAKGVSADKITYQVKVEASNTDSNQVKRQVKFTQPPRVKAWLEYPENLSLNENGQVKPNPFKLELHLRNSGGTPAYEMRGQAIFPPGMDLAKKDISTKYIGALQPGEEYVIPWNVKLSQLVDGTMTFGVETNSLNSPKQSITAKVNIPELKKKVFILPLKEEVKTGEYFGVQLRAANIPQMNKILMNLKYNKELARANYVSRGTLFVKESSTGMELLPWSESEIDREQEIITGIGGDLSQTNKISGVIAEVYFKALKPGELVLNIDQAEILDDNGNKISIQTGELKVKIVK